MALEIQDVGFEFDGSGGQSKTQILTFSSIVTSATAAVRSFRQKFKNGGQNVETAEVAITQVTPTENLVEVTAFLDIQPSNNKNYTGRIEAVVFAAVND